MKKIVLGLSLLLGSLFTINAQEISDNAVGLRLGSNDGFGAEISFQRKLKENNRLEVNLGLRNGFSDLKLSGLYEWVWSLEENLNWYAGAGGGFYDANKASIFASGVVGIEYNLENDVNLPLLISLDYRPEIGITGDLNGLNSDLGLSLRYQF
jgi:hypothetical protein|tara:strand:+ start:1130 stop:1588 length:459 start_codon:yes stop_codon:yes gene_type:complete